MTEGKQEAILRKVRGLLAKANSTEFEGERQVFMEKADALMEEYAISEIMLRMGEDSRAKLVVRHEQDISWWFDLKELDTDARSSIYWMWQSCVRHCRCYGGTMNTYSHKGTERTVVVYGLPADLSYLDMVFTDLLIQMVAKIRPTYDSKKSDGENIAAAKAAGMKWAAIALWMGHPEWVVYGRIQDNGVLVRTYNKYLKETGGIKIKANPRTYQYSFISSFCSTIESRMRQMAAGRESSHTGSMEIALRDVREQAREALWGEFPDLRPHPPTCKCSQCSARRKPVKYRNRTTSMVGESQGFTAGQNARIISNDPALRQRPAIDS